MAASCESWSWLSAKGMKMRAGLCTPVKVTYTFWKTLMHTCAHTYIHTLYCLPSIPRMVKVYLKSLTHVVRLLFIYASGSLYRCTTEIPFHGRFIPGFTSLDILIHRCLVFGHLRCEPHLQVKAATNGLKSWSIFKISVRNCRCANPYPIRVGCTQAKNTAV